MVSILSVQRENIVHADLKKGIRDVVTNGLNSVSAEGKYSTCWSQKKELEMWWQMDSIPSVRREYIVPADLQKRNKSSVD